MDRPDRPTPAVGLRLQECYLLHTTVGLIQLVSCSCTSIHPVSISIHPYPTPDPSLHVRPPHPLPPPQATSLSATTGTPEPQFKHPLALSPTAANPGHMPASLVPVRTLSIPSGGPLPPSIHHLVQSLPQTRPSKKTGLPAHNMCYPWENTRVTQPMSQTHIIEPSPEHNKGPPQYPANEPWEPIC